MNPLVLGSNPSRPSFPLWNPDAIECQLAHTEKNEIRAVYNAAQYLPERRKMMQWWADKLDALAADTGARGQQRPAVSEVSP